MHFGFLSIFPELERILSIDNLSIHLPIFMKVHMQTKVHRHTHIHMIHIIYTRIRMLCLCTHRFIHRNTDSIPISYIEWRIGTVTRTATATHLLSVTPLTRSGLLYQQLYWKMGMGSRVDILYPNEVLPGMAG